MQLSPTNQKQHLTVLDLASITKRDSDTRKVSAKHVGKLADNILEVGLLQPIVVDQHNMLLAGGHRLAAIKKIQQEKGKLFESRFPGSLVPVKVIETDKSDMQAALRIEIAENEQRRDYTGKELENVIERLRAAGYSESKGGRTKKGTTHITHALAGLLNKSERYARRIMFKSDPVKVATKAAAEKKASNVSLRTLLAHRIEKLLSKNEWNVATLAQKSKVSKSMLYSIAKEETAANIDTVEKIARAFGIDAYKLLT